MQYSRLGTTEIRTGYRYPSGSVQRATTRRKDEISQDAPGL
jgi:hypothetical protein